MESQSNVSVTVANSRKKFLLLSVAVILIMVAISTAAILVYDKVSYFFKKIENRFSFSSFLLSHL